jgi:type I restriction enzyme S subunit
VNSTDAQKDSGEIGILKTSAVTFGVFDPNQHKVVVSEEVERVAVPVKADRLIVSRMNTRDLVGANAYTARSFPDLFLPDRLWQVEPNDEKDISMQWLSYVFNFQWKNGVFASLATGTSASMKNLSKGSIFNMELAFPKIKEQKEIAEILSTIDEKISVNKKLKEKLTLLKKGLMQDLLSGKVRTV